MNAAPIDHQAERQVLSWMLTADPADRADVEALATKLKDEHFHDATTRSAFIAAQQLLNDGHAVSTAAVVEALHAQGTTTPTHQDLARLVLDVPSAAATATVAARRLDELRRWRSIIDLGEHARRAWARGGIDVNQVIAQGITDLEALASKDRAEFVSMDRVLEQRVVELREAKGKPVRRMPTGWASFDKLTGGLGEGELAVIAGATGGGKTAAAMRIAEEVVRKDRYVLVASAEMAAWEIGDRLLSRATEIDSTWIRDNKLGGEQFGRLEQAAKFDCWKRMLVMDSDDAMSVQDIRRVARQLKGRVDLALVVVDYLQLITSPAGAFERGRTRQAEVAAVARGLKITAKGMQIPILALSQFNREALRSGEEPELHHLRESGEIEQASNTVVFVWRRDDDPQEHIRLICKKARSGPTNRQVKLIWDGPTVSFDREIA